MSNMPSYPASIDGMERVSRVAVVVLNNIDINNNNNN